MKALRQVHREAASVGGVPLARATWQLVFEHGFIFGPMILTIIIIDMMVIMRNFGSFFADSTPPKGFLEYN